MDHQEDTTAALKGISPLSSKTHSPPMAMSPTGTTETLAPASQSSNPNDSATTHDRIDISAIELYLRPRIMAFQKRHDAGTLSKEDAELDGLYTRWQIAERELGDAALDAAIGIFPGKGLDEESKTRMGLKLMEGGRRRVEAEMMFVEAMLERFEGLEEQRAAIAREIENGWRSIDKGGGGVRAEEKVRSSHVHQEDVEGKLDEEMGVEQRQAMEGARKRYVVK